MYIFEIHVPNAVMPTTKYSARKYSINVLSIRMMNPADHHMILSLTNVNAVVNTISVNGMIYMKNLFTENTLDLMIYAIGMMTAIMLRITNFRLPRFASIL